MRFLLGFISLIFLLSACSTTRNIAVTSRGQLVMCGEIEPTLTGGYFTIHNAQTTCTGAFNVGVPSDKITAPVTCTDGRQGQATAVRQLNGYDGYGKIVFNDGQHYDFVFGRLSKPFLPGSR